MPRDITRRVLDRPISSPFAPRENPLRRRIGWVVLGVLAWAIYAGVISDHSFLRIARLRAELAASQRELDRVKTEGAELESRLSDPAARRAHSEAVLREQHGMARPGEIVYRFRDGRVDSTASR